MGLICNEWMPSQIAIRNVVLQIHIYALNNIELDAFESIDSTLISFCSMSRWIKEQSLQTKFNGPSVHTCTLIKNWYCKYQEWKWSMKKVKRHSIKQIMHLRN